MPRIHPARATAHTVGQRQTDGDEETGMSDDGLIERSLG